MVLSSSYVRALTTFCVQPQRSEWDEVSPLQKGRPGRSRSRRRRRRIRREIISHRWRHRCVCVWRAGGGHQQGARTTWSTHAACFPSSSSSLLPPPCWAFFFSSSSSPPPPPILLFTVCLSLAAPNSTSQWPCRAPIVAALTCGFYAMTSAYRCRHHLPSTAILFYPLARSLLLIQTAVSFFLFLFLVIIPLAVVANDTTLSWLCSSLAPAAAL